MELRLKSITNLFAAVCVGVLTGLLASGFNAIILFGVQWAKVLLDYSALFYIILPVVAALVTSLLYATAFKNDNSGFGVVQVFVEMRFVNTFLMRPLSVLWRVVGTLFTLVCGLTAGRFGPIIHLGASVGSNVAYWFKSDEQQIRLLIGCGAAGAIATVFNLPFFATLFILEVLFRDKSFNFLSPLLLSSVIANRVGVALLGDRLPLAINFSGDGAWTSALGIYLVLGVTTGLLAVLYMYTIDRATMLFEKQKQMWIRLVFAAVAVGVIAFFFHDQFEIHSAATNRILNGQIGFGILLVLVFGRILTTALTLGSGFLGGNFYPGITIGAATGALYWHMLSWIGINQVSQLELGLLGIVGMLSGFLHAPLASVVLCLEISKDITMIIPAMIVSAISLTIAHTLYGQDIFAKPLGRVLTKYIHAEHPVDQQRGTE